MLRFLNALIYSMIPQNGVTPDNAVREIFSLFPEVCQLCNKTVVGIFYDIPDWYRFARRMGPFHNDAHCVSCHQELMDKDGHCCYCRN